MLRAELREEEEEEVLTLAIILFLHSPFLNLIFENQITNN
jgi:hypothetical protein